MCTFSDSIGNISARFFKMHYTVQESETSRSPAAVCSSAPLQCATACPDMAFHIDHDCECVYKHTPASRSHTGNMTRVCMCMCEQVY